MPNEKVFPKTPSERLLWKILLLVWALFSAFIILGTVAPRLGYHLPYSFIIVLILGIVAICLVVYISLVAIRRIRSQ